MKDPQLDQLQNDLNTIRAITGDELPFDRQDVWSIRILGFFAVLPAIVGISGETSRSILLLAATPFVLAVFFYLIRNYRATHPSKACPHDKRKEYRHGIPVMMVVVLFLFGLRFWAISAGAPASVANGCVMMFLGLMLIIEGLYNSERRATVLPGIAAIIGGSMWPFSDYNQLWTLTWTSVAISLVGASVIMHKQIATRNRRDDCTH